MSERIGLFSVSIRFSHGSRVGVEMSGRRRFTTPRPLNRRILGMWLLAIALRCVSLPALADGVQLITLAGQKAMLTDPGSEPAGAPNADVTIVEYFDYNCPYCKKLAPVFEELLKTDHHVRIIYKDWPIFGGVSVYAAKAALAAQRQSKYLLAYHALMNGPRLETPAQVDATLSHAGVNLEALKKDRANYSAEIDALIARNDVEAHALSLRGTPGIVVGRQLLPGIVDLGDLKQLVAAARSSQ
jgi:protein-disulfide isomerase